MRRHGWPSATRTADQIHRERLARPNVLVLALSELLLSIWLGKLASKNVLSRDNRADVECHRLRREHDLLLAMFLGGDLTVVEDDLARKEIRRSYFNLC